jgi:hypothetical protein
LAGAKVLLAQALVRALERVLERVQGLSEVRVPAAVLQVPVRVRVRVQPEQELERVQVQVEPLWAADRRRNRRWH